VRAVGNFVRLVTEDMMNKSDFRECTDKAIAVLVQNATKGNNMKVWQQDLLFFVCASSYIIYTVQIVGMCVCMLAYSSRRDKPICTKLSMVIS
jgi:hypothetical protein